MSICVYVEVDDVIDELSDDDLLKEVKSRGLNGVLAEREGLKGNLTTRDVTDIMEAARSGNARELLIIMQSCLGINRLHSPEDFAKLPRDPETGRPVIQ